MLVQQQQQELIQIVASPAMHNGHDKEVQGENVI